MNKRIRKLGTARSGQRGLGIKENQRARELYEEIFSEDSKAFVDYYFKVKASENEIYVVENADTDEILATLHLNPYPVILCGHKVNTAYIVAVATRADCRHQGMMASLLEISIQDLYQKESPFTWLMPAAEAIYRPFGFRFIYQKNQMVLYTKESSSHGERTSELICRPAKTDDLAELAVFADKMLPGIAKVYAIHDRDYFAQRMQELASESGHLVLFISGGSICGYFLASPKESEAWEIVVEKAHEAEAKAALLAWFREKECVQVKITAFPESWEEQGDCSHISAIMGRIVYLERFVQYLKTDQKRRWCVKLRDDLIAENNGIFQITLGTDGGSLERMRDGGSNIRQMDIGELLEEIFKVPVYLNELV